MNELVWRTEKRILKELRPLEENPFGIISDEHKQRLREKIESLGVFEIPTIDTQNNLLTFNKRWHILMLLGRGDEEMDVRIPTRELTEEERKKVIISSNVHEGQWNREVLDKVFADIDLKGIGLDMSQIKMPEVLAKSAQEQFKPDYPVVAEFSEKYDAVVIVCRNEIDANFIREVLKLELAQCYKCEAVGTTHVIDATKFMQVWNSK